jgi:hypothetical protein
MEMPDLLASRKVPCQGVPRDTADVTAEYILLLYLGRIRNLWLNI